MTSPVSVLLMKLCGLCSIPESHVGMAWRLKNEIPNSHILDQVSLDLVPRPFLAPVFDHLQYAKMEREGLGDFVTCDVVG